MPQRSAFEAAADCRRLPVNDKSRVPGCRLNQFSKMEGAGFVFTLFKELCIQISSMKKSKHLVEELRLRLGVLEQPIRKLELGSVDNDRALQRLKHNLTALRDLVIQVGKRGNIARFFRNRGDVTDLYKFNGLISDCVTDLNLLTTLEIVTSVREIRLMHEPDTTQVLTEPRNPEADRCLTCDGARSFYDKHYNRALSLTWEQFWFCFSTNLSKAGIHSLYFFKKVFMTLRSSQPEGQVDVRELNTIFVRWTEPTERKKLLDMAKVGSKLEKLVDNFQYPYDQPLVLKLTLIDPLHSHEVNDLITITPTGLSTHPMTRVVRFGRGEPSLNHVSFDVNAPGLERDMFQIYCNSEGYYIIDSENSGSCTIRLRKNVDTILTSGSLFQVGDAVFHVSGVTEERICLKSIRGGGDIDGQPFYFNKASELTEITIGRRSQTKPPDISIDSTRVSRRHAKILHEQGNWVLIDVGSNNGTWFNLMNDSYSRARKPSPPWKLKAGEVIGFELNKCEVYSV
jgi:hypothetical protein